MRILPGTLFKRLAVFFGLALLLAIGSSVLILNSIFGARFLEQTQRVQWAVAQNIADVLLEELGTAPDEERLIFKLHQIERVNPAIQVFILDEAGNIRFWGRQRNADARFPPKQTLESVRTFLTPELNRSLPLLGPHPASLDEQRIFSAAKIPLYGKNHLVYVLLESDRQQAAYAGVRERYSVYGTVVVVTVMLMLTGALAAVLYLLVTRRFDGLVRTVDRIADGDLSARYGDRYADEISHLGRRINGMADRLLGALEDAQRNDRLRRELVANISHDLGGPLTALQGYLYRVLEERTELSNKTRRDLESGLKNVRMLTELSSELLELSKLEAKEKTPELETFPIGDLILQEVVPKLRAAAALQNVEISAAFEDTSTTVRADVMMIERVLQNLIGNAIRYNRPGGRVEIALETAGETVWVSVSDTGAGIDPDDLPRIFDRFYRGNRARTKGGTGLGLAIVRQIIEAHGQQITVTSTPEVGTTFRFSLSRPEGPPA